MISRVYGFSEVSFFLDIAGFIPEDNITTGVNIIASDLVSTVFLPLVKG